jgi:AraC-like DNA-binding protein
MDVIATFHPDATLAEAFVVGAMTRPQIAMVGDHSVVGIRFLPAAGGSALGIDATVLTDQQASIDDVVQHHHAIRDVFRSLHRNASNAQALFLFAKSVGLDGRAVTPLVRHAALLLGTRTPPVRIERVARELGVSRQHLAREFSAHAGLSPKLFSQICRVRGMLADVQVRASHDRQHQVHPSIMKQSWSAVAAEYGYADQSHLIAEVRAILGQTPRQWLSSAGSNIPIVPVPIAAV